ncbi:sodium:calcium antiporter [Natronomonas gomsonensis]|jgi:cation:H+ antiporter|uniref:sodium:calcium antiporter n=1 Tax=Natronomonas gomsonensis TaxID=1046043 RepID=UPI0020CA4A6D|nr:sodium:calcium antiporter [Natronomonas gomsonensis]MCY4731772.1 sodium:calcium antiporter [Natronomonas gomsonensis]
MVLGGFLPNTPAVSVGLILFGTSLLWVGTGWLEGAAEQLSAYYGLPAVVQGSIVVAIGSSFPEFTTVVFSAFAGVVDIGVGGIVGSAIFNILVIPGLAGLAADEPLEASRAIVYKEAQFYMIAVSALVITLALAVIYYPVPDAGALAGEITRPLAVIPLLLYGLYLFIQWQDVSDHDAEDLRDGISVGREWAKLLAGLVVIVVGVEELVVGVESIGAAFGIPEFIAGLTIVAAATSLPDLLVSVRSAQAGNGLTSLGNVLGSNTFDLLVAIPVGVLIVDGITIDFAVAVPMMGVLTLATVLLFGMLRTELSLTDFESYTLLAAYALFIAWVVAETVGATAFLKSI